jgi:hypothetical protein
VIIGKAVARRIPEEGKKKKRKLNSSFIILADQMQSMRERGGVESKR